MLAICAVKMRLNLQMKDVVRLMSTLHLKLEYKYPQTRFVVLRQKYEADASNMYQKRVSTNRYLSHMYRSYIRLLLLVYEIFVLSSYIIAMYVMDDKTVKRIICEPFLVRLTDMILEFLHAIIFLPANVGLKVF